VAPSLTTNQSHNINPETVQVKPDVNSINDELDKMKPGDEVESKPIKATKIPEGFEVEAEKKIEY
jgi:hypothetical protein